MSTYLIELDKEIEKQIQDLEFLKRKSASQKTIDVKKSYLAGLKRARGIYKLTTQTQEYAAKRNG